MVGAIKVGLRLGAPKFYDYIRAFGFGQPTGVDLPERKPRDASPRGKLDAVSVGSISMGQEIGVTPLQLITAMSGNGQWGAVRQATTSSAHCAAARRWSNRPQPQPPPRDPRDLLPRRCAACLRRRAQGHG